ncbi:hypothetical protein BH20ACT5_BH20ACT5_24420 [soil metagenome]
MSQSRVSAVHPPGGAPDPVALAQAAYDADPTLGAHAHPTLGAHADPDLSAHVAGCPDCTAVLAALAAVRADLAALPAEPIPDQVATRINHALAAEAAVASGDAVVAGGDTEPAGRHRNERVADLAAAHRARRYQLVGGIAAALVIFGGGGYLVSQTTGGSDSTAISADGGAETGDEQAGAAVDSAPAGLPSFDRASLEAAVPELLALAAERGGEDAGEPTGDDAAEPPATGGDAEPESADEDSGADGETLEAPSAATDCLTELPLRGEGPLSATRVNYTGRDAYALIFATDDPGLVQVTVISASCEPDTTPAVLEEFTAPR